MTKKHNISVLGMGYIGVVTALGFAKEGSNVIGLDINKNIITKLKNLELSFSEPGLAELLEDSSVNSRLEFTTDLKYAYNNSDISFLGWIEKF